MSIDDHDSADPTYLSTHAAPKGRAVLAQVEEYWRSLRKGRHLPLRSDVDPARIDAALPHAFILERVAPGVARMRVAGQALSHLLGAEARGMPLSVFFSADARPKLRGYLDRTFDGPAVVELPVRTSGGAFRQPLMGRLLLLPLLGNDDQASRALGALLLDGVARSRAPRQFDIPEGAPLRCEPVERPALRQVASMGGRVTPIRRDPSASERPWLRLVVANG